VVFLIKYCFFYIVSQQKVSPLLPVERNGWRGLHEAADAWWDKVLLQRPVQHLCAWRVCGKCLYINLFDGCILTFADITV